MVLVFYNLKYNYPKLSMTAIKEILKTINDLKKKESSLSKDDVLSVLKATKTITKHKQIVNSLISLFKTLDSKTFYKVETLTKRELQILKCVGNGKNTKDIALLLNLKSSTIETHRKNIRKKLGLVGKGKLIEYAILNNLKISNS